jgi:hypothetical protein
MHSRQESLRDSKLPLQDLQHRRHAVRRAARAGDHTPPLIGGVFVTVNAIHIRRGISARRGNDNPFRVREGNMLEGLRVSCELPRTFDNVLCA